MTIRVIRANLGDDVLFDIVREWTEFPCVEKMAHVKFYQEVLFLISEHTGHTVTELNQIFASNFGISVISMDINEFRGFMAVIIQIAIELGIDIQERALRL